MTESRHINILKLRIGVLRAVNMIIELAPALKKSFENDLKKFENKFIDFLDAPTNENLFAVCNIWDFINSRIFEELYGGRSLNE